MTGAPKKRSVELLQNLESMPLPSTKKPPDDVDPSLSSDFTSHERGVYSGICGYWCVGGGGDFSIVIRSAFRYDNEDILNGPPTPTDAHREIWYVGAGGAITALSDPQQEWEEMKIKLEATLKALRNL